MLIESIFLGIPIPTIFMATNRDSSWEVIDGLQRISSIIRFAANQDSEARKKLDKIDYLKLAGLEKLTSMNGKTIQDLPNSIKLDFLLKPLKIVTLSDKSDEQVRFDLFQRLNTGGITLSEQEIRNCVYKGRFNDFIKRLSNDSRLRKITSKPQRALTDGTYEELVLRFFAYLYHRDSFKHNVKDFLNDYMSWASNNYNEEEYEDIFNKVFSQLENLPHGIRKNTGIKTTSTVFWEAITVGAAVAIQAGKESLYLSDFYDWVINPDFNKLITGATNSLHMIEARIQYACEKFSR